MTVAAPSVYARTSDPETSHEAASQLHKRSSAVDAVVRFLAENDRPEGWTEYEITAAIGSDLGDCPWHRISDARREGLAEWALNDEDKKILRPGASGRRQGASRITPKGREHHTA